MAMQRANPLPIGRYWVDVPAAHVLEFQGWLADHANKVTVIKHETHLELSWYLFEVTSPVEWKGPGFPTIDEGAQSQADTGERPPPPPSISEQVEQAGDTLKAGLTIGGLALGGLILYKLLSR